MNRNIIIDDYLEKPYWVIDILPKQVPADRRGQFFTIEQFFLCDEQTERRCRQFCNILMKLNCYEDIAVCGLSEEWVVNPHPVTLILIRFGNAEVSNDARRGFCWAMRYCK